MDSWAYHRRRNHRRDIVSTSKNKSAMLEHKCSLKDAEFTVLPSWLYREKGSQGELFRLWETGWER